MFAICMLFGDLAIPTSFHLYFLVNSKEQCRGIGTRGARGLEPPGQNLEGQSPLLLLKKR